MLSVRTIRAAVGGGVVPRVLIAGGGIGGLTTALACYRAGLQPVVFERSSAPTATASGTAMTASAIGDYRAGSGIGLWGPALRALRSLGIDQQLTSKGQFMSCAGYRSGATGAWLLRPTPAAATATAAADSITGCLCLRRDDLHAVLYDAVNAAAEKASQSRAGDAGTDAVASTAGTVLYNQQIVSFEQSMTAAADINSAVRVRLSSGDEVSGAVLIGADGLYSAVRNQLFPHIRPRYAGYRYARAVISDPVRSREPAYESWGVGRRFGVVPLQPPQLFWFAVTDRPESDALRIAEAGAGAGAAAGTSSSGERTVVGSAEHLAELRADFGSSFHSPVKELLQATDAADVLTTDIYDLPPLADWGRGNVSLVGDSAHGMTPNLAQGACHAIEDALSVVEKLRWANFQNTQTGAGAGAGALAFANALRTYERARRPRAHFIQRMSRLVGWAGSRGGRLASVRDAVLSHTPVFIATAAFNAMHRLLLGWSYTAPNTSGIALYPRILGAEVFESIRQLSPNGLYRFHTSQPGKGVVVTGTASVGRGSALSSRIADLMQLPAAFAHGTVKVDVSHFADGREFWFRSFTSDRGVATTLGTGQWMEDERTFTESEGPMRLKFALVPVPNPAAASDPAAPKWVGYKHELTGFELSLWPWFWSRRTVDPAITNSELALTVADLNGRYRIPLPRLFWPRVEASTIATPEGWKYRIVVDAPRLWFGLSLGRILKYEGEITAVTLKE